MITSGTYTDELLEGILIQLVDMQTSQSLQVAELSVRADALGGYIHYLAGGLAVIVGMMAYRLGAGK